MYPKAHFHNDWAVLSPNKEEAKRVQHELDSHLPADAEVTTWLDNGLPRVDIAFDDERILSPRENLNLGASLRQSIDKGLVYLTEMTPHSVCFYVNRTDLMPGPIVLSQFDGMGAPFEDVNYPGLKAGASRFNAGCLRGLRPFRSYAPLREHFGPNRP